MTAIAAPEAVRRRPAQVLIGEAGRRQIQGLRSEAVRPVDPASFGETAHFAIAGFRAALVENPHYQKATALTASRGAIPDNGRGPEISFDVGQYSYTVISVDKAVGSSELDTRTEVHSKLHLTKVRISDGVTVADVDMRSSAKIGPDEGDNEYLGGFATADVEGKSNSAGVPGEPEYLEGTNALFKANRDFRDILVRN